MEYKFECQMCDGVVTGPSKEAVVEKIKKHAATKHDMDPMPKEELEKRKKMIKQV